MRSGCDVLVVEDDRTMNAIMCKYVQMAGFSARGALDGNSALAASRVRAPDAVLLDLMLPDTTGFEVCKVLRSEEATRDVPVIMVTAMTDEESRSHAKECGVTEYITKPFDPKHLLETLKRHTAQ